MSEQNPSAQADASKVKATETEPVEANVGEKDEASAITYTGEDVAGIVKTRVAREQKKFAAERELYEKQIAELRETKEATPKPDKSDLDYKAKVAAAFEAEKKQLTAKLDKYRQQTLRSQVEKALADKDCLDPEVAVLDLTSKGIISYGDDDEIVINHEKLLTLDEVLTDYLSKKPHLVRPKTQGGAGTKAPRNIETAGTTVDAMIAAMNATRPTGRKLFGGP